MKELSDEQEFQKISSIFNRHANRMQKETGQKTQLIENNFVKSQKKTSKKKEVLANYVETPLHSSNMSTKEKRKNSSPIQENHQYGYSTDYDSDSDSVSTFRLDLSNRHSQTNIDNDVSFENPSSEKKEMSSCFNTPLPVTQPFAGEINRKKVEKKIEKPEIEKITKKQKKTTKSISDPRKRNFNPEVVIDLTDLNDLPNPKSNISSKPRAKKLKLSSSDHSKKFDHSDRTLDEDQLQEMILEAETRAKQFKILLADMPLRTRLPNSQSADDREIEHLNKTFEVNVTLKDDPDDQNHVEVKPAKKKEAIKKKPFIDYEYFQQNKIKPPYKYAYLIKLAFENSQSQRLTGREIADWIKSNFAYYNNLARLSAGIGVTLNEKDMFQKDNQPRSGSKFVWSIDIEKYDKWEETCGNRITSRFH